MKNLKRVIAVLCASICMFVALTGEVKAQELAKSGGDIAYGCVQQSMQSYSKYDEASPDCVVGDNGQCVLPSRLEVGTTYKIKNTNPTYDHICMQYKSADVEGNTQPQYKFVTPFPSTNTAVVECNILANQVYQEKGKEANSTFQQKYENELVKDVMEIELNVFGKDLALNDGTVYLGEGACQY